MAASENRRARTRASRSAWYVVQVNTGREEAMCAEIRRVCTDYDQTAKPQDKVNLAECFSPKFQGRRKWKGEWQDLQRPLLPGYVIADAQNPAALMQALRNVRGFCRLLAAEETYAPLDEKERAWVDARTQGADRVIPLSFGVKEGDTYTVTEGPLKGKEGIITRVDRKNCMAHLEFHVGPMTVKATVGLVIMAKSD